MTDTQITDEELEHIRDIARGFAPKHNAGRRDRVLLSIHQRDQPTAGSGGGASGPGSLRPAEGGDVTRAHELRRAAFCVVRSVE